jgi:tRNA threonylcarbamoyladenosine modification (KEOPS) complex  Pcc1 subunit
MFGSTPAASYTVNSATSITAVPPASVTSGTYSLTVNTFAGASKPVISCSGGGTISINSATSTTNNGCLGSVDLSNAGLTELSGTFNTSQNVTEVKLPNTLQIISNNAFYNTGIAKLVLPPSITSICEGCISGNQKLTSVEMSGSSSVSVSFGSRTFQNNPVLQRVSFGYSADTSLNLTSYTSSSVFMFQGSTKLTTVNSCAASGSYLATFLAGTNAQDTNNPKRTNTFNGSSYPTVACDTGVAVTGGGTTPVGNGDNYPTIASFTASVSGTSVTLTAGTITDAINSQGLQAKEWLMSTDNYNWSTINYIDTASRAPASYVKTGLIVGNTYYFRFKQRSFRDYNIVYSPDITVTIPPASTVATLSALALSSGTLSPTFASSTESYTTSVANSVATGYTVTATKSDSGATTVQYVGATGTTPFTGALAVGANVIRTVVTAADGTTIKTYTVTVTRAGSSDATLSALALSAGTLSPTFASGTETYTASVANSVTSITVTPTRTQANATITVNGTSVTSGSASGSISLNVGSNTITVIVTAQDGTTTKSYTVTVTRAPSAIATLSALALSSGTLSPTFASGTTSYTASVANSVATGYTVTATKSESNATIVQYLGANGTTAFTGALAVGPNVIRTVVTAQDGTTSSTYTVTVTRLSNDATLSALALSSGTLNPSFDSGTASYTASVANSVTSITVTPTRTQANATITVNGTSVTSGSASGSISLNVGSNTISVVVTAQDGTTTGTYTVTVTRAASTDATLSALALSSGTLSPSFASATESYTASVANSVTSITVTPVRTQANATITVNGTSVTSGAASGSISLNVGSNTITVIVTAQDGTTTKSYTVSVTRLSNDATLSALALSS